MNFPFIKKIRREEWFLLGITFFYLLIFFAINKWQKMDFFSFISYEAKSFKSSLEWYSGLLVVLIFYGFWLVFKKPVQLIFQDTKFEKIANKLTQVPKIDLRDFLRTFFFVLLAFSTFTIALGALTLSCQNRLMNQEFFIWEEQFFGVQPFIWFHTLANPFYHLMYLLSEVIIQCFMSFSMMVGVTLIILYIWGKKKDFLAYVAAGFIGCIMGFFFWYAYPINSPNNFYIDHNKMPGEFNPPQNVLDLQAEIRDDQRAIHPISTFPSMHTMWAIMIVYYLAKVKKEILYLGVPWLVFLILGTAYLAQHYFVDALWAMPMAYISILLGNKLGTWFAKQNPSS